MLQSSFGVIPNVRAKGKSSVLISDILNRMQTEEPVNSPDVIYPSLIPFLSSKSVLMLVFLFISD